uniref:Uncharacterized protein n=1 Tax=Anguilla anguilla TaxID=7936 RepID=A0A0E9UV19_ANGAN
MSKTEVHRSARRQSKTLQGHTTAKSLL